MLERVIVIGASAGGLYALTEIFSELPSGFKFPIVVVQHRAAGQSELLEDVLQAKCKLEIKQADEKENIKNGVIYIAPPGYHLFIEQDHRFSLSIDPPVKHSIPSIDVTFQSAAEAFGHLLVGIVLTGSSSDGAEGIKTIKEFRGVTIAQEPKEAKFPFMPKSAIDTKMVDHILNLQGIKRFITELKPL
jgi:two-component system chemotaxis response regulator CheB